MEGLPQLSPTALELCLQEADSTFTSPPPPDTFLPNTTPPAEQAKPWGEKGASTQQPHTTSPVEEQGDPVPDEKAPIKRTVFSRKQLSVLEARFVQQSFLSKEERRELAEQLKLTERQIMIWFQNRRGRLKRRGASDTAYTPNKLHDLHHRRPYPFLYGMMTQSFTYPNMHRQYQQALATTQQTQALSQQVTPPTSAPVTQSPPNVNMFNPMYASSLQQSQTASFQAMNQGFNYAHNAYYPYAHHIHNSQEHPTRGYARTNHNLSYSPEQLQQTTPLTFTTPQVRSPPFGSPTEHGNISASSYGSDSDNIQVSSPSSSAVPYQSGAYKQCQYSSGKLTPQTSPVVSPERQYGYTTQFVGYSAPVQNSQDMYSAYGMMPRDKVSSCQVSY